MNNKKKTYTQLIKVGVKVITNKEGKLSIESLGSDHNLYSWIGDAKGVFCLVSFFLIN